MVFLSKIPLATPTRVTYTGETVVAPIAQRTSIRKLPRAGATTLQELYGPSYEKKGFGWTPLDLLPVAAGFAAGLVPGGQQVLGLLGAMDMNGGFAGSGLGSGGPCPPGTYCKGVPIEYGGFATCLGSCVPLTTGPYTPAPQFPTGSVPSPIGPIYTEPETGRIIDIRKKLGKKRKRMNYANQRALRRALRRATGYARQQKAIRKVASEFAREFGPKRSQPRRDLGRGHVHVR